MATLEDGPFPTPPKPADLAAFDSHPLFMRSLPEDVGADPVLSALQSLVHEGTPDEVAQNFKEQGNEYFAGKRYREAMSFYSQGIDANPSDTALREALLMNRAACNLELKNYGEVLRDCSLALTLNNRSSKAYYRSALALLALDKLEESIDCCDRCLGFNPGNAAVEGVKQKATKAKEAKTRKQESEVQKWKEKSKESLRMKRALEERNISQVPSTSHSTMPTTEIPRPFFSEDGSNCLVFPVLFHYPQHRMTEMVAQFRETDTFSDHFDVMFPPNAAPPEWDRAGEYVNDRRLVVYTITRKKRLLKVGTEMTLGALIKTASGKDRPAVKKVEEGDGLEMSEGCLHVVVVVKGVVEDKWVSEFKGT